MNKTGKKYIGINTDEPLGAIFQVGWEGAPDRNKCGRKSLAGIGYKSNPLAAGVPHAIIEPQYGIESSRCSGFDSASLRVLINNRVRTSFMAPGRRPSSDALKLVTSG